MAALRCKPGDLAVIAFHDQVPAVVGKPVQLTNEPPFYIGSQAFWHLAESFVMIWPADSADARGRKIRAGVPHVVLSMADRCLRPIRPQADDAVDEMVRLVGEAPKTLTEVREVSHG
jgi:hypothetical protein